MNAHNRTHQNLATGCAGGRPTLGVGYIATDTISNQLIALCDGPCFQRWVIENVEDWHPEWHTTVTEYQREHAMVCAHCLACGVIVLEPRRCMVHDTECPAWYWELSPQGLGFVQHYLNGSDFDRVPDWVMDLAQVVGMREPDMPPSELAQRFLARPQ